MSDYKNFYKRPHHLVLPDNVRQILTSSFDENLVSISGKNLVGIHQSIFKECFNLEDIDFPNLMYFSKDKFEKCTKLLEKHTNKEGLCIIDNKLINADKYKDKKIVIPNSIRLIADDLFIDNKNIQNIVLPFYLYRCSLIVPEWINEVILPLDILDTILILNKGEADIVYKKTEKEYIELLKKGRLIYNKTKVLPYTFGELLENNYTQKEIEYALQRHLKLDELLSLKYTMKQANDYFKEKENNLELDSF